MYRRSSLLSSRRAHRSLLLAIVALVIAVAVPAAVFADTITGTQGSVPSAMENESWGKAPERVGDSLEVQAAGAEVVVVYAPGTSSVAMARAAGAAGATLGSARPGKTSKSVPVGVYSSSGQTSAQLVAKFEKQAGVVAVAPNSTLRLTGTSEADGAQLQLAQEGLFQPNDPLFGEQWALENTGQVPGVVDADIDALTAWESGGGSAAVVVAVIDSGVDYWHSDLADNLWINPAEAAAPSDGLDNDGNGRVDDVYGIDTVNGDSDPRDDYGHGTHVAGTIAAAGGNEAVTVGVAYETKIMALKAFDAAGAGDVYSVIQCINYAIDMKSRGVNIVAINASFESDADFYDAGTGEDPLEVAIEAAGEAGIVFVAAAGNSGRDIDAVPLYPASYDSNNIIAVGASDSYDARATFDGWGSNYGASSVDLFAPGKSILSTYPTYLVAPDTVERLFSDKMEGGAGNWTTGGFGSTWALTDEAYWPGSESHSWSDSPVTVENPEGVYANNSRTTLTSRAIDLVSESWSGRCLGFAVAYDLQPEKDYLIVKVSGDNGATWQAVDYLTGNGEGYCWIQIPEGMVTSTFKIQFVLETDSSNDEPYDGVYIDDVCVGGSEPSGLMDGTSMAAPFVTGTVALLAAAVPADTVSARIDRVLATVDTPASLDGLCATDGRLNAGRALAATAPAPAITEIWPAAGSTAGGVEVDIYGSDFYGVRLAGAGGVTFGGVSALSYTVDSSEHIVAVAPPGVEGSTVQVQVHAVSGATADTEFDDFTYVVPPAITGVTPATGPTNGGTTVSIVGSNFVEVSSVTFGGVSAKSYWIESPGLLKAIVPAHAAGEVRVQVTTLAGATPDSAYDSFTYTPVITVQQNDPKLSYLGTWPQTASSYASGGTYVSTNTAGSSLTVTFEGTYLAVVGRTSYDYGKAWVSIDGEEAGYADFYSQVAKQQQVVYNTGMLTSAPHTVRFTWAGDKREGSSGTTISVDALQVIGSVTQAPLVERFQQDDRNISYTGAWGSVSSWRLSGLSFMYADSPGASVNVKFEGAYLAWVAKTGPAYGKARVVLDGDVEHPMTVDLYSPYDKYKQKVYDTGLLDEGEHTLSIYWVGEKNKYAAGYRVNADTFDVLGDLAEAPAAPPITWTYQQTDSRITYVGPWSTRWASAASAGNFYYTSTVGAAALVELTGTSVELLAKKGPVYGKMEVSLTGPEGALLANEIVDLYSAGEEFKASVWSSPALEPLADGQTYSLSIKCLGEKNELSGAAVIDIDALSITGIMAPADKPQRFQEDNAFIDYSAGWIATGTNWAYSAAGFKYSNSPGAKVSVRFEGTYLAWVTKTSPQYGMARVVLDGDVEHPIIVDLYSSYSKYKQKVYETGLLAPGAHTLTIEWTGQKRAGAAGSYIGVDTFDVLGVLVDEPE